MFIADGGGGVDAAGAKASADVNNLLGRKRRARAGDTGEDVGEFGLGADVAIWREMVDDFEGDVAAKDDNGV